MKAKMHASGNLTICAENSLEAYALRKWSEENKDKFPATLIVDTSFPVPTDVKEMQNNE